MCNTENGEIAIAPNDVLTKNGMEPARRAGQRASFGIFGRNTASSPSAGRNAQT